jgi:hypothetical protein
MASQPPRSIFQTNENIGVLEMTLEVEGQWKN